MDMLRKLRLIFAHDVPAGSDRNGAVAKQPVAARKSIHIDISGHCEHIPSLIQCRIGCNQRAALFGNNQDSNQKEDKIVIDNGGASPYSGLEDKTPPLLPEEQKIISALTREPRLIDDVIAETGIPTARMLAVITLLQVKGLVKQHPGKHVSLT